MEGLVKDKNNPIHRETIYVTTIQMKHMVKVNLNLNQINYFPKLNLKLRKSPTSIRKL